MKLLAIDTSASACSLALQLGDVLVEHHVIAPMQQAREILPALQALLSENKIQLNQLDALAFGCGPGSFTGVRIAVSVVQGLAYAANLSVIPISSLAATAQAAYLQHGWKKLLVAMDARMNEVYWAKYQVSENGLVVLQGLESVAPPEAMLVDETDWCGVGSAWAEYRERISYLPKEIDPSMLPTARAILPLAVQSFAEGKWVAAESATPVYLRDRVALKIGDRLKSPNTTKLRG